MRRSASLTFGNEGWTSPRSQRPTGTPRTAEDVREEYGEVRYVSLVPINDRLCVVAWCLRGEALRVISLRKANSRERA
nr:BrnT family toxin [Paracoccus shanxieyensis]